MSLSAATLGHPGSARNHPVHFDSLDLRRAFSQVPQSLVVVGATVNGSPQGLVASTFTVGVSLEPALVTFAVQHTSNTWPILRDHASHLGVSLIGADHQGICRQIASNDRAKRFDGVAFTTDDDASLTLTGVPLWLKTRIYNQFTAGDHDIVVLEVLDLGIDESTTGLVFHRSSFTPLIEPEA